MYGVPSQVNAGVPAAANGAAFAVSPLLGVIVAVLTIAFAVVALTKIAPKRAANQR